LLDEFDFRRYHLFVHFSSSLHGLTLGLSKTVNRWLSEIAARLLDRGAAGNNVYGGRRLLCRLYRD